MGIQLARYSEATSPLPRLKQFHHVSRRVLAQYLLPARTGDDVIAKLRANAPHLVDQFRKILRLDDEPVPAAGLGLAAVRHRTRGRGARPRDPQSEIIAREDRDVRAELLLHRKAEPLCVERDGGVDVV